MQTDKNFDRYHRQVMLSEIGPKGQEKLKNSSILLIGAGGLGSSAAFYLAAAGVGVLGIMDDDVVDKSNLNRQILHHPGTIGEPKVESARQTLEKFNPDITINPYKLKFTSAKQLEKLIQRYDLVLDCTDNYDTRYAINHACIDQKKPWIYGAVSEFEGQVMTIIPGKTPCYNCLYPAAPAMSKEAAAVLGVMPGLIGISQASEALKYILNIGKLLEGRLLFVDLMEMHFDAMTITRNKNCPACSHLIDSS
ncbi:HesA/MoeB/ThiF family protein [Desulfobacula toluolica]|uniref:MoeB: molybdopterin biosynthesis protein n=1 Tax=Desulfobacula toluolica (strain DSM 7467 / Tol2) TaxID=651182 RepID=K0NCR6_DESTT|nr:HesA/MoeB/ThiF family protein [Desulfobacula toluolica]CCK78646.1 MoeB: molybdopterin biosynthesis protein [Desulfobacula toluolica Tol2]